MSKSPAAGNGQWENRLQLAISNGQIACGLQWAILVSVKISIISVISVPYLLCHSQSLNTLNFKNFLNKEDPGLTFGTDLTFNQ
jgi:hypothetical protein